MSDWLETEPPEKADWLSDETTAVSKAVALPLTLAQRRRAAEAEEEIISVAATIPVDDEAGRRELAQAFRKLNFTQRIYLNALIETGFVKELARKKVQQTTGVMPSPTQVKSWEMTKKVMLAMELATKYAPVYLDPRTNMIRLNHVIESTLTPRRRFAGGEDTGESEIAAGEALRGIELAAKMNGQLRDDVTGSNRVTVIINLADDEPKGAIVSEQ